MSRSDWICSKCGKYKDPQQLDYNTGECWSCQDGVVDSNMNKLASILTSHNIPLPSKDIISARWKARFNDWYVLTEDGWFWFDPLDHLWKKCKEPDFA